MSETKTRADIWVLKTIDPEPATIGPPPMLTYAANLPMRHMPEGVSLDRQFVAAAKARFYKVKV